MSSRNEILKIFENKKDLMNDRISAGIESNRKGYAFVTLVDKNGETVKDAQITIKQKTHDFKYGANLFMLDEFSTAEKNEQYRNCFAEAFNMATLPFYWNSLEQEPGRTRYTKESYKLYRRPAPDLCLEYCRENLIEPKMHCLNYAATVPAWAKGTVDWEKQCMTKHFRELSERYAEQIRMWEVTNETFWEDQNPTALYRQDDFIEWSFSLAEKYFPANKLIINEALPRVWSPRWFHGNRSPYYMQIERALSKGARIDTIGMQYHMFYGREQEKAEAELLYDPEYLYNVMDTYAKFGKPLQVTEISIPAYSCDPEDEEVQAQIIKNLYSIWFSHGAMEAIIYWNLPDGYAHRAVPGDMTQGENIYYGGLLRFDLSPKKAYHVICDLFRKEWRTDLQLRTDSGAFSFKGFYGEYDLEITAGTGTVHRSIHLNKAMNNQFKIEL